MILHVLKICKGCLTSYEARSKLLKGEYTWGFYRVRLKGLVGLGKAVWTMAHIVVRRLNWFWSVLFKLSEAGSRDLRTCPT